MQVNISGQHLEVTDALRDYVHEKFDRLARHFDKITNVQVIMQVEKLKQKIEATLHIAGGEVVANAEGPKICTPPSICSPTNLIVN